MDVIEPTEINIIELIIKQVSNNKYKPNYIWLPIDKCNVCSNNSLKFTDNRTKLVCDNCGTEHHKIKLK